MTKEAHGTLLVTGTGKVQVAPDEALVTLGVLTDGKTAAEAVADNARTTQALVDAVSSQPNHGVTTTGLGLSPIMSHDEATGVGTVVGFRASNGVEVRTKVGHAGQVHDAGVAAGANQSSGISFRVQDETAHREEALRMAVEHAHSEAKLVAKAARVALDGVESIQIDPGGGPIIHRAIALDSRAAATPVLPEERTIAASVQIRFRTRER